MKRALATVCLLVVTAGCGSDRGGYEAAVTAPGAIVVSDAWARTTAPGQTVGAVYFTIEAVAADTLVSISVPATVAAAVEIHEMVVDESAAAAGAETSGTEQMTMRELDSGLPLPGGVTVLVEPGRFHLMLVDLAQPLVAGSTFAATLEFEHAAPLTVDVAVGETAP